jgi:hypothetical protein
MRVKNQADLDYLVQTLEAADFLRGEAALEALAAFLRARLADPRSSPVLAAVEGTPDLPTLLAHAMRFVTLDPEGGRRGQAAIAALFDLVFPAVSTGRINDPSRRRPGDVVVGEGTTPILSAEVRQKNVTAAEVAQFVARLGAEGVRRGLIAMLSPSQPQLPLEGLQAEAWERYAVSLDFVVGLKPALRAALAWTALPLDDALRQFVARMHLRIQEFECAPGSAEAWMQPFINGAPDG